MNLAYLSATEALRRFRRGELSPVELMTAVLDRAEATEGVVNAFADRYFEDAMRQAREAAERYRSGTARPLEGIPVAVKEEQPIAGRPLRNGSMLMRDTVADETHPVAERIIAAGGIVHARTTTPEFSCAGFTHGRLWGITRNPWHPEFSAGGSSGGSGAALAAGSTTLATGSDMAGSIRIPASCNGVVGYKPPYGRVPALPPFHLDHYCHDGPMARTVADCALLQNVIAGRHPVDPVSLPAPEALPLTSEGVAGRRIAWCPTLGDYPVESEVDDATREVVEVLRRAGAVVERVELAWSRAEIMAAAWAHFGAIVAPLTESEIEGREGEVEPYTMDFLERARRGQEDFGLHAALLVESTVQADLTRVFGWADALVCPTSGTPALRAGQDYVDGSLRVAGVPLEHNLEAPLTVPFNLASRCPVLSVPSGRAATGVPTGVQVVGRPYDDHTVFAVGAVIAGASPWFAEPDWTPGLD